MGCFEVVFADVVLGPTCQTHVVVDPFHLASHLFVQAAHERIPYNDGHNSPLVRYLSLVAADPDLLPCRGHGSPGRRDEQALEAGVRSQRRSSSCRRGASPVEHRGSSHNNLGSGAQARGLVAITRCRTSSDGINAARVEVGAGAQEDRVVAIRRHQVRGVGVAQARWSRDLGAGRSVAVVVVQRAVVDVSPARATACLAPRRSTPRTPCSRIVARLTSLAPA